MSHSILRFLPIVLVIVLVVGALAFLQQRETLKKRMDDLLAKANKVATSKLPSPTPFVTKTENSGFTIPSVTPTTTPKAEVSPLATPSASATPSATPTASENKGEVIKATSKGGLATNNTKTTIVCTPVYGMGNQCVEHVVVDTAVDTTIFYNLAALSYLGGLAAFVKAKKS